MPKAAMTLPENVEITALLEDVAQGRADAASALLPAVYGELRKLAAANMARLRPGQTLQPTALVHEAWEKLVGRKDPGWNGRGHFFGAAAQAMREILVDQIRRKSANKRGRGRAPLALDAADGVAAPAVDIDDVIAIDDALRALEAEHPRKVRIVEMRYFAGLTVEEIAEALGTTTRTVEREWRFARALLFDALSAERRPR